jgi:hypothetical protein
MSNFKSIECAGGCGKEREVARNVESWRCLSCIMENRPADYHRHRETHQPDPAEQLELGEGQS